MIKKDRGATKGDLIEGEKGFHRFYNLGRQRGGDCIGTGTLVKRGVGGGLFWGGGGGGWGGGGGVFWGFLLWGVGGGGVCFGGVGGFGGGFLGGWVVFEGVGGCGVVCCFGGGCWVLWWGFFLVGGVGLWCCLFLGGGLLFKYVEKRVSNKKRRIKGGWGLLEYELTPKT